MADEAGDIGIGPVTATPPPPGKPGTPEGAPAPAPAPAAPPTAVPPPESDTQRFIRRRASAPSEAETKAAWTAAAIPTSQTQAAPVVLQPVKRHGLAGVMDELGKFLSGTQGAEIYYDENGNRYVQHPPMTHAQQWASVGLAAAQGAARGLAAGRGHGPGTAALAGLQGGLQDAQQSDALKDEQAQRSWTMERQAKIDKANSITQALKNAELSFRLNRLQPEADQHDLDFAEKQRDYFVNTLHATPIPGVYDSADFHTVKQAHPDILKEWAENGNIQAVLTTDPATGKKGVQFYSIPVEYLDKPVAPGTQGLRFVRGDKLGTGRLETYTPSDPNLSERNLITSNQVAYQQLKQDQDAAKGVFEAQKAGAEAGKAVIDAATEQRTRNLENQARQSEISKNYADAALTRAKANNLAQGLNEDGSIRTSNLNPLNPADHDAIVQGMLDHTLDIVSLFGTRTSSPIRAKYVADVKKIDPTWDEGAYKRIQEVKTEYASQKPQSVGAQITSFNIFMGHAYDFMQELAQFRGKTSNNRYLNMTKNELRKNWNADPSVPTIYNSMDTMEREFGALIEGKVLTDKDNDDLKQRLDMGMSMNQMEAVTKNNMKLGVTRLGAKNEAYRNLVGYDVPGLLQPQTQDALRYAASGNDFESQTLEDAVTRWLPRSFTPRGTQPQTTINPNEQQVLVPRTGTIWVLRNNQWVDTGRKPQ